MDYFELLKSAKIIKEFCSNDGIYDEERCPFFRGYDKNSNCRIVKCALNLDHTSPANWTLNK